jgi:hypothetical protein
MTDDSTERAPIGRIDVSGLPGPDPRPEPDWSTVRKVSESGGFIDRSPRATRRHLTGRNHQFNAKATADTIRRFNAICDGQRWVAGLALEHLVALGEAALRRGTIAEAIDTLERELGAKVLRGRASGNNRASHGRESRRRSHVGGAISTPGCICSRRVDASFF